MMNWLPWILAVAMGYEVQGQAYSDIQDRGDGHQRGFPSLFCFVNNRIYMMGQSFPSGCNTCTCRSNNQVLCTLIACPEESPCKVGQPLPGAACGGLRDLPCPDPDKYECVGRPVPGLFDGPGVCCLEPDLCQLPSVTGPCRASFPRWYYDYNEKKCKQFIYGGCGGNANRFETEAECQQRCGEDVCQLPSEVGPCDGVCPSWYYNYGEKKCKEFNYGCCGGNANRFETKTKCQQRCGEEQPQCKIGNPLEGVSCGGFRPTGPLPCPDGYECVGEALAYDGPGVCCLKSDPAQPQCKIGNPLEGVSCGGRPPIPCPDSRYVCVGEALLFDGPGVCCLKSAQDLCQLPSVTGRCKAFIPSWYYDYKEKKCKQFIYGGCGGNGNRFKTQAECQKKCGEEPVCKGRKQLPKRTCGGLMGKPCPRNYECVGQLVPVDGLGVCCRKGQAQTDPLCPRLNPSLHARCRLEHCPRRGCPGRQKCCPSHCGTTCRALRGPCGINPPLADSSGTQLFCGRGRNRVDCPQDHYCAIHPTDRYAVCCRYV